MSSDEGTPSSRHSSVCVEAPQSEHSDRESSGEAEVVQTPQRDPQPQTLQAQPQEPTELQPSQLHQQPTPRAQLLEQQQEQPRLEGSQQHRLFQQPQQFVHTQRQIELEPTQIDLQRQLQEHLAQRRTAQQSTSQEQQGQPSQEPGTGRRIQFTASVSRPQPGPPEENWYRPWEHNRDRASFAIGFSAAFATDIFLDISRVFTLALRLGIAHNPPAHSSEATIRFGDVYYLHGIARTAHDTLIRAMGSLGHKNRMLLNRALGNVTALAFLCLVLVHLAFMSPHTQLDSARTLSDLVATAGGWQDFRWSCNNNSGIEQTLPPTLIQIEIVNSSWQQHWSFWSSPTKNSSNETTGADSADPSTKEKAEANATSTLEGELAKDDHTNSTVRQSPGEILLQRLEDMALWSYKLAFPAPCYEVTLGVSSPAWLEIQSHKMRRMIGMKTVRLELSAQDERLFGPSWARELMSMFRLHKLYIMHALPIHFFDGFDGKQSCYIESPNLFALDVGQTKRAIDLMPIVNSVAMSKTQGWQRFHSIWQRCLSVGAVLALGAVCSILLSALLRCVMILSCRMHIYNSLTIRQMKRYAFVAEAMRRVNCYSSTELLELWTLWAASTSLLCWLLWEAFQHSGCAFGCLICYAVAEYWGMVHVRTMQSRWLFPRCISLIYAGGLVYIRWWPLCPSWLLLWSIGSAQLWLMYFLLNNFDCYVTLPAQPPHQLMARSMLLPAQTLVRAPVRKPKAKGASVKTAKPKRAVKKMTSQNTQTDSVGIGMNWNQAVNRTGGQTSQTQDDVASERKRSSERSTMRLEPMDSRSDISQGPRLRRPPAIPEG
eukprot:TRINITY_DN80423_c0_g1_i1.p1 TRINITY_DN80423_c0_g1~~TRINITY_DN80423_c0_g1_i1.p1  ORF type:complete len:828 (+),score=67.41 TRINITY_DN80423_c0_g1_i1:77-2560(+)